MPMEEGGQKPALYCDALWRVTIRTWPGVNDGVRTTKHTFEATVPANSPTDALQGIYERMYADGLRQPNRDDSGPEEHVTIERVFES